MKDLKLLLRKAIFSGKVFEGHVSNIADIIDKSTDDELEEFFESDEEALTLLVELESLRTSLAE